MLRALALALLFGALANQAGAQDADALLDEGIALREAGQDAEALARFEEAHAIDPSARSLAQIALAEQALGRFAEAESHLRQALASEADRFIRRNRALLERALAEIGEHVGALALSGGIDGARVVVDGVEQGRLPLGAPLRLTTGSRAVEVAAEGWLPFRATVLLRGGETTTLEVSLAPIPVVVEAAEVAPPAPVPEPEPAGAGWRLPTGLALAGAGAVALGLGVGLVVVREEHAQARLSCSDADPACRARFQAALDAEAGAGAAFVVGGLLAAGGAVLLALELAGAPSEDASFACAPALLGASCAGRF